MTFEDTPLESLDDWLEEDLEKSNLIEKNKTCSLQNIVLQENKTPSLKHAECAVAQDTLTRIPITNVYCLLNSIRHTEQMIKDKQFLKRSAPSPPPSPSPTVTKKQRNSSTDLKRQRNTDAARRSRQRKAFKMACLETKVDGLKKDNERLRVKVAVLESEVNYASEKEKLNRQRVLELEAQLANTYQQLLTKNVVSDVK